MDNQDVSKLKAKGRLELLVLFFLLVLAVGGVVEYRHSTAPMSSATVVFDYTDDAKLEENKNIYASQKKLPSQAQYKMIVAPSEAKAPVSELNPPKAQDINVSAAQNDDTLEPDLIRHLKEPISEHVSGNPSEISSDAKPYADNITSNDRKLPPRDGAAELTEYLQKLHQKAESVSRPQSALGQIAERPIVKKTKRQPQPVFQEGKIEIYDSDKGVVAVQESVEIRVSTKDVQADTVVNEKTLPNDKMQSEELKSLSNSDKTTSENQSPNINTGGEQSIEMRTIVEETQDIQNEQLENSDNVKATAVLNPSDNLQPTLLVPLKTEKSVNENNLSKPDGSQIISNDAETIAENAPVDMIKEMQDNNAKAKQNNILSSETLTLDNDVSSTSDDVNVPVSASAPAAEFVTPSSTETNANADVNVAEDKAVKSKKANEALENLFKKISEPNALDSSSSSIPQNGEHVDEGTLQKQSGESVINSSSSSQAIENNAKSNVKPTAKQEESGAVDMMKAIVSRK